MRLPGSRHFTARCQQRAIPPFIAALLLDEGRSVRQHGADVFFLAQEARLRIRRGMGDRMYRSIEDFLDAYVVCADDGNAITAGWRCERIKQP